MNFAASAGRSIRTSIQSGVYAALTASALLLLSIFAGAARAQNVPVPSIAQPLVPMTANPGATNLTLRINGTGFIPTSVIRWNGSPLNTTYVTSDKLQARVPTLLTAAVGTAAITVSNPSSPVPRVSSPVYLPINTPISSVAFNSASYRTGINPTGVTIADFNDDGLLDLAICNDYDSTISILLQNSDGSFGPQTTFPAYGFPYNIFAGDFNNDGILDLVTVDKQGNSISLFLGNGGGTFQSPRNFPTLGGDPIGLNIGDLNGDGNLDVVSVNSNGETVSVFLGNGDGTFQTAVPYSVGSQPNDVAIGDFNGDGIPDLAVADNPSAFVGILIGNGDGTFQPKVGYPTGRGPNAIHAADLNGDGILDIITTNASGTVSILLGNGNGTFQPVYNLVGETFPSYAIATYDFNNDGHVDIMVPELNDDELTLFLGNGDGTFQNPINYPVLMHPDAFAVADFNNDGKLDLAVADETSNMVTILTQTPSPVSVNPSTLQFGNVKTGKHSAQMTSTITNNSGASLTVSRISLSGQNASEFAQQNTCPATLNAGQSCTVTALFKPRSTGKKSAIVKITDSVGTQVVTLLGTGTN